MGLSREDTLDVQLTKLGPFTHRLITEQRPQLFAKLRTANHAKDSTAVTALEAELLALNQTIAENSAKLDAIEKELYSIRRSKKRDRSL